MEFEVWLQTHGTMYRGDNATDCMESAWNAAVKSTAEHIILAIEMRKFRTEIGGKIQELNSHQGVANSVFQHLQDEVKSDFLINKHLEI